MSGILRPFVNLVAPGKKQLPLGPLTIDWSHSLANGLIGCFVPGAMGMVELTGNVENVLIGNPTWSMTPEGPGIFAQPSSPAPNINGIYATAPAVFKTATAMSLYFRGFVNQSSSTNFCNVMGITFDNANSSPFNVYTLAADSTNLESHLVQYWNNAGTAANSGAINNSAWTVGTIQSNLATFKVGGNATFYQSGTSLNSVSFGAGAPNTSATSQLLLNCGGPAHTPDTTNATCLCGYFWNRELSPTEAVWLDQYPYDFLVPAEAELPAFMLAAAFKPWFAIGSNHFIGPGQY